MSYKYTGSFEHWVPQILEGWRNGRDHHSIAAGLLRVHGTRDNWGRLKSPEDPPTESMVKYIISRYAGTYKKPTRRRTKSSGWQTWTPQKQFMEFEAEMIHHHGPT